ncbi:mitochondrial hypoxia responsive domain containing [Pyrenophora seminiperda CCB06]|uniref:Mitochondrial hypoxia responsive domain containing n=1 Tax=Pyrenophora seminiperda CCB06 TaxID=1302712 RepID=A0A3M7LY66_9PLEO|nr:mitochondrial hypoxia responsive domain containing [Pyrenophora seminiperda CCB06]
MKVLTKEEEEAHYNATIKGGSIGGVIGTAVGAAGVMAASRRFHSFRALTVPFRAFLVASTGTFLSLLLIVPPQNTTSSTHRRRNARSSGGTLAALLGSFAIEGADAAKGKGRWETIRVIDPNDPEHKHIIEKKIHHERYAGEDQWREMVEAEEQREKERKAVAQGKQHQAKQHQNAADKKEEKAEKGEQKNKEKS